MTEKEFMRQVWRPYDTVEIDGGMKGRVTSVCFPSRSVRVTITKEVHEWFKCDMIVSHTSAAGEADDLAIIENLHNKLMAAEERINTQQDIINKQNDKLAGKPDEGQLKKLRKAANKIADALTSIDARLGQVDEYLSALNVPKDVEEEA